MKKLILFILTLTIILSVSACKPQEYIEQEKPNEQPETQSQFDSKYLPPEGQIHLFAGQDLAAVGGLKRHSDGYIDYFGMPAGVTSYTGIADMDGLNRYANWGAGDVHARAYLTDESFDNTMLAIGLWMVGDLQNTIDGVHDGYLEELSQFIIEYEAPVLLRIGYEFNYSANNYHPTQYKEAFIYVCDYLDNANVDNYETVWQANEYGSASQIAIYYPGDEYVDWCGYSYFNGDPTVIGQGILEFAREHNKPVFIAEVTPRFDLMLEDSAEVWEAWYEPFLEHVNNNSDVIKAVSYINCRWRTQTMWQGGGWGDSRLQIDKYLADKWLEVLNSGMFNVQSIVDEVPQYIETEEDAYPEGLLMPGETIEGALEAEVDGTAVGNVVPYTDSFASGGRGMAYIYEPGDRLHFEDMPACKSVTIRYAVNFGDIKDFTGEYGVIGIFIDGQRVLDLEFENTGSWVENYNIIDIEVDVPEGSTFSIGYDEGDVAMNVDCIVPNE